MERLNDSRFLQDVRNSADLPALVSDYVSLKKAGRNRFKALCPFHAEKTPSFVVDGEKQLFYCFGCGAGGDTIRFAMLQEKVEFHEAVRWLAVRNGIPVPETGGRGWREERVLQEANQAACLFFRRQLAGDHPQGRKARAYLEARHLLPETIDRFQIGYAPDSWDALKNHLLREGFKGQELFQAGLLAKKEETQRTYDRFRGRIIFPIRDLSGNCVGFGGRTLGDGVPKYLNSPESPIFDKSKILYGLEAARSAIRTASTAVLVEGYIDFLTLFQAGMESVIATLGTSFGAGHSRLLRRFADRVVVNFDPDTAGSAATRRSLEVLLEQGFDVRILRLPDGEDPDRFLNREGVDKYRQRLEAAPAYLQDLIVEAAAKHSGEDPGAKLAALREVLPFIAKLESPVSRLSYAGPLAEALGVEEDSVLQELKDALRTRRTDLREEVAEAISRTQEVECRLLGFLLEDSERRSGLLETLRDEDIAAPPARQILKVIRRMDTDGSQVSYESVHRNLDGEEERRLLARLGSSPGPRVTEQDALDCLEAMERQRLSREMNRVQRELEKGGDRLEALLVRKMELGKRIEAMNRQRSRVAGRSTVSPAV